MDNLQIIMWLFVILFIPFGWIIFIIYMIYQHVTKGDTDIDWKEEEEDE